MKKFFGLITVIGVLSGCVDPPDYPETPEIEFANLSRTNISQRDSLTISFTFKDGDGDIGFKNLDTISDFNPCDTNLTENETLNLFMVDNRTGCFEVFNTPFLPRKGSYKAISGTVRVTLGGATTCCKPPDGVPCQPTSDYPVDTVKYTIQLKDRAGHLSNEIETPPIFIECAN